MTGHVLIGAVDARLVAVGPGHAGLEVVADDDRGHAAEEGEHAHVAADPVGQPLAGPRLAIDIAGGSERGDEQLHRRRHASGRIDHVDGVAGVIDEHLLTGDMVLAHGRRDATLPGIEAHTEPRIAISVRMLGPVLLPDQRAGYALAPQFPIDLAPIGFMARLRGCLARTRKQQPLQRRIGHRLGQGPAEPRGPSPSQVVAHRSLADPQSGGDQAAAQAVLVLQS